MTNVMIETYFTVKFQFFSRKSSKTPSAQSFDLYKSELYMLNSYTSYTQRLLLLSSKEGRLKPSFRSFMVTTTSWLSHSIFFRYFWVLFCVLFSTMKFWRSVISYDGYSYIAFGRRLTFQRTRFSFFRVYTIYSVLVCYLDLYLSYRFRKFKHS